ncbi:hypothetical protein ACTFIZ_012213 [Dictyostelium cf. discoideum]
MKFYLIPCLILIIFFSSVVNSVCRNCAKENEICGNDLVECSYETYCFYNFSLPSTQIRKCVKYLREGDECAKQSDENKCIRGTSCRMDKKNVYKCLGYGFSTLGEDCEFNSDCATDELVCNNEKCTLDSTKDCRGDSANCNYDEYCETKYIGGIDYTYSCKLIKLEGESCLSDNDCLGNLLCRENRCVQKPLIQFGGVCPFDQDVCDYNKGLYCSNGICIEYVEPIKRSCSPNATIDTCPYTQTCSCSDGECYDTQLNPPEYNKNFYSDELKKCAYDNECSTNVNLISSKSCVSKHCRKEICAYKTSNYKTKETDDCGYGAFLRDLYCNSSFKITQSITSLFIILSLIFCNSGGTCSDDTKCLNFYNSSLPRCAKYLRSGDECDPKVGLCIIGTECVLDKNNVYRCLDYGFKSLGERCELQSDCIEYLDCLNNVCSHPTTYTHCHDINENCNYDEYCYCIVSSNCICQKINTQGSSCNYSRDCLGGMTCNNGICGNPQLIELGGNCDRTYNCDTNNDCYYNNYCDYNKGLYCSNNICEEFVEPISKPCSSNATVSQCSSYQTCSCSDDKCYQSSIYPPEKIKLVALSQLEKCAYDNKCSLNVNLYSSESCLSKNCRKEICQRYIGDYKVKEGDSCGNEAFREDLLHCNSNSSPKITQSLPYLLIVIFIVFQITFY